MFIASEFLYVQPCGLLFTNEEQESLAHEVISMVAVHINMSLALLVVWFFHNM